MLIDTTEQSIVKAEVIDTQDFRIPKYPYLRINRFLSSYRDEVQNQKFTSWVMLLQRLGIIGWEIELKNLPRQDNQPTALSILYCIALVVDKYNFIVINDSLILHAAYRDKDIAGGAVIQ